MGTVHQLGFRILKITVFTFILYHPLAHSHSCIRGHLDFFKVSTFES